MPSRSPYDPTHGDRVQIGFGGPAGTVIRRRKSDGRGAYFKVCLDSGEWVWPDHAVAESSGAHERRCAECGLAFRTDTPLEVHCPNCVRRLNRQDPGPRASSYERRQRARGMP